MLSYGIGYGLVLIKGYDEIKITVQFFDVFRPLAHQFPALCPVGESGRPFQVQPVIKLDFATDVTPSLSVYFLVDTHG